jgi:hypothetical protein
MQGKKYTVTFALLLISLEILVVGAWTGWMQKKVDLIPLVGIGASLCFLIRSFFSGLYFMRGIATVTGGFIISSVAVATASIILQSELSIALDMPLSFMIAYALFAIFGIILLTIGFQVKSKKFYKGLT